jgi:hypothetical protein
MFFGSVVAVVGTALCTAAQNGMLFLRRRAKLTRSDQILAGMFIAGRLLLGVGGVVVGAIGPVSTQNFCAFGFR